MRLDYGLGVTVNDHPIWRKGDAWRSLPGSNLTTCMHNYFSINNNNIVFASWCISLATTSEMNEQYAVYCTYRIVVTERCEGTVERSINVRLGWCTALIIIVHTKFK